MFHRSPNFQRKLTLKEEMFVRVRNILTISAQHIRRIVIPKGNSILGGQTQSPGSACLAYCSVFFSLVVAGSSSNSGTAPPSSMSSTDVPKEGVSWSQDTLKMLGFFYGGSTTECC